MGPVGPGGFGGFGGVGGFGAVRCGAVRCGAVRCGAVAVGHSRCGSNRPRGQGVSRAWHGMAWHGIAWHGGAVPPGSGQRRRRPTRPAARRLSPLGQWPIVAVVVGGSARASRGEGAATTMARPPSGVRATAANAMRHGGPVERRRGESITATSDRGPRAYSPFGVGDGHGVDGRAASSRVRSFTVVNGAFSRRRRGSSGRWPAVCGRRWAHSHLELDARRCLRFEARF